MTILYCATLVLLSIAIGMLIEKVLFTDKYKAKWEKTLNQRIADLEDDEKWIVDFAKRLGLD